MPELRTARAIWVTPSLIAWPADAVPPGPVSWRLHTSSDGSLVVGDEVRGGTSYTLTRRSAALPRAVVKSHPELKGYLVLRTSRAASARAREILRGQVVVAAYAAGELAEVTGVQIPYVLDALYAGETASRAYGVTWSGGVPAFRLWAPTARSVTLLIWRGPASTVPGHPVSAATRITAERDIDGSWLVRGEAAWRDAPYLYEVVVFAPSTGNVETNLVTDPYSVALTVDSTRSVAVDLEDAAWAPSDWRTTSAPRLAATVDQTIYELHIRDFSICDETVPAAHRGRYLAFADDSAGTRHLAELSRAGLNTVHLLPSFDIATVPEDPASRREPDGDLRAYPPDGLHQQRLIAATSAHDGFNWGYDPLHYFVPEGSYASSAEAAHGGSRVMEFRTMVGGLHRLGLRVVLDQVFNHTTASGQSPRSILDRIVPGYYHRLDALGEVADSACCSNTATEHAMMQRLMIDALLVWARHYRVDGFRFDLMGHHSVETMRAARAALDACIDRRAITMYGEGWNFGEVADNARFVQAIQGQLGGTSIGTFNDRLRDAVRGGGPFDDDPRKQGFATGSSTDPNGAPANGDAAAQAASLASDTDIVQLGLAGNLRDVVFISQATGTRVTGATLTYHGVPAGYAREPDEVVAYVDAHDNETLFDALALKLPVSVTMADRIRMNTLALATVALSQSQAFWHAGAELLRSKSLDRNSYDSGDWFNRWDVTGEDNGFGRGLPPYAENGSRWAVLKTLLADPAFKPSAADVASARVAAQELLRLRFSTRLFRLGSAEAITSKVTFPVSGTPAAHPGVIVLRIDDAVGEPVDGEIAQVLVVFNATPRAVQQQVAVLAGTPLVLSPVQRAGADPVVKASDWTHSTGTATVPARTVAVFQQLRHAHVPRHGPRADTGTVPAR